MSITIDEAVARLERFRAASPLGGDTVLVLSLTGSEIETQDVDDLVLDANANGAVVEVRVRVSCLVEDPEEWG